MTQKLIARKWTHAFEQDAGDGTKVFRPTEEKFALSRGREKLDLSNVIGNRSTIGPDDRNIKAEGEWSLDETDKTLTFSESQTESTPIVYDVISLTAERMVLRRKPADGK